MSKRTDQTERVRDRRTETESSLPWTVESMLFGYVILLIVSLVVATWLQPPLFLCPFMYRPSRQRFSLALPFSSFPPLELHPFAWPPSSIHRSLHLCICIDVAYHALFSRAASALASIPHSHLHRRHVRDMTRVVEAPVQLTIDAATWRHKICVCLYARLLLFVVTCKRPSIPYIMLVIGTHIHTQGRTHIISLHSLLGS